MMKRILIIFSLLLTAVVTAVAAEVTFSVVPPRQVVAGNKFAVTFRLQNGEGSGLKAPQISGCRLLYGPSVSTMSSYQVVNGAATSSTTVDYTFQYLAETPGTYTIGSASIVVNGKTLQSREARFTILPADKNSRQQSQSGYQSRNSGGAVVDDISTQTPDKSVTSDDVFIRIILSKSQAYEQEAIECTIKLYTKYQISSFMAKSQPNYDGFLIEEMSIQPALNEMEHYRGQNYMTALLKKCILFPQKSGKLTINSGQYDLTVVQYEQINMGFFGTRRPVEKKIQVNSNSVSINILPLPQPQPDGFTGAVGQFTIDSKLNGSNFRTGEAGSLTYTIKGTGNVKYVKEPEIDFPSEFELYTPHTDISAHVSGSNVTGSMTIEYTFVPQVVGDFTIPSDKFVYFNPTTKEYVTLTTDSYNIKVAKGVGGTSSSSVDKQGITAKNTDILHIKLGDKAQTRNYVFAVRQWWYWTAYGVLALALLVGVIAAAQRIKLNADVAGRRMARAGKVARKRLKLAREYMQKHQNDKFHEEMLKAIWGYLSDKFSMPSSQLTRENIAVELAKHGATDLLTKRYINLLDQCEMARYTPNQSDQQIEDLYNEAVDVMSQKI